MAFGVRAFFPPEVTKVGRGESGFGRACIGFGAKSGSFGLVRGGTRERSGGVDCFRADGSRVNSSHRGVVVAQGFSNVDSCNVDDRPDFLFVIFGLGKAEREFCDVEVGLVASEDGVTDSADIFNRGSLSVHQDFEVLQLEGCVGAEVFWRWDKVEAKLTHFDNIEACGDQRNSFDSDYQSGGF